MRVGIILLSCLGLVQGYNILCIQGLPSRSHYNLMFGIVKPLLQAGHEITLVTVYPETKPVKNLTIIDVSHLQETIEGINVLDKSTMGMSLIKEFARNVSNTVISSPAVRDVLTIKQFDAVINEWFITDADAGYAAVQQAPWILLLGTTLSPYMEHLVDSVKSIPTIPLMLNEADIPMSLWQRIKNTIMFFAFIINELLVEMSITENDYRKNFGPIAEARQITLPPLQEVKHNISVLFVNSHPSLAPAQSVPPNVIDIAGYHIDDAPPLPKDLQELLDSSKQGYIYFSMGSVVQAKYFPESTKKALTKIFEQLPYTVLWKDGPTEKLPKNIYVKHWMPQTSILAHPNIKLFITHGGLLSIIESLQYGVPILAVPVYGDQPSNANRAAKDGYGLRVDFSEDMADKLDIAIREIMSNASYYKRAKEVSYLFMSRPVTSSQLIKHYVELAIRSKGAQHLRSKSQLYSWYEILMLDQLVLFLLFFLIVFSGVKKVWMSLKQSEKIKND
ncbi:UDP-glucosyltransferase 2-like [Aricia agestis]|uniref:UDP-glucosyltransferase 2-like n=1 Tax=Aricia agestis TaxID=91739 RepID=UPI001C20319B|nr:UDP-glucosyltransferase 2-like [Aricia agestis]